MKKVTIHYRRLIDRNFADVDFRGAFETGLAAMIGGRRLSDADEVRITTSSDGYRMCLLSPESSDHFCFGEIAVFREGDVPIAERDADGQVTLRTIELNGNEEAVRGSSYFMSRGPHLAILHHESSTRFLDDYFRWLMRAPLGHLAQDELLALQPLIQVGGEAIAIREVKSLKIRAEVERTELRVDAAPQDARHSKSFRRMIDRQTLSGPAIRNVFRQVGLTNGSLENLSDEDLQNLELELLVRKKDGNRIEPLPNGLIDGVINDGLDRAAEFETAGARRRGETVVARHVAEIGVAGAYYELTSVRAALWAALAEWSNQGLI